MERAYAAIESRINTTKGTLDSVLTEKTRYDDMAYALTRPSEETVVPVASTVQETPEDYSDLQTALIEYLNFIDGFAQENQMNQWKGFFEQEIGENIVYDDFMSETKIDIQSITSQAADNVRGVLQTILKIDAAFDKFQEIHHNNQIVTKTRQTRRSNPFESINGLRSEITALKENYNQNSVNSLKSKIFLLQKNTLGESEKQKVLLAQRKETVTHLRNDLENIGKEILNSRQNISDLKESIQKEITSHDASFTRDSLTKIQGLLSEKYALTQSQAQMLKKQDQLQTNLDDILGKMRGARIFTRIHEVKIPAALNKLSADLQQIERNHAIQSLVLPIQAVLDNHAQSINFDESEPLQQVFNAYENGDLQTVATLLQQQPDLINQHDGDGYTLLFQAVIDGEVEFVKTLLQHNNPAPLLEVEASDGLTYDVFSSLWEATNESPEYFSTYETIQNILIEYSKDTNQENLIQVANERYNTIRSS
jgi:ankyrin repeat protein